MCLTSQIKKLESTLYSQEKYIKYLYTQFEGYEEEIESLRKINSKLRSQLKDSLETISFKEECLVVLENKITEIENINEQLKIRILKYAFILKNKMADTHNDFEMDTASYEEIVQEIKICTNILHSRVNILTHDQEILDISKDAQEKIKKLAEILHIRMAKEMEEKVFHWRTSYENKEDENESLLEGFKILKNDYDELIEKHSRLLDEKDFYEREYYNLKESFQGHQEELKKAIDEKNHEIFVIRENYMSINAQQSNRHAAEKQELITARDNLITERDIWITERGNLIAERDIMDTQRILRTNERNILRNQIQLLRTNIEAYTTRIHRQRAAMKIQFQVLRIRNLNPPIVNNPPPLLQNNISWLLLH
jgi:DNA repair exonuclease SbcCD ATPase subunit